MLGRQRDLRRAQRKHKRQAAWISCGGTRLPIPCVIWDLSEGGARLAPARLSALPELFSLNLTRDGKSRRVCRVVWRKKPYVGVRFVEQSSEGADLEEIPRRKGNTAANLSSPPRPPLASDGAIPSLLPQVRYADLGPGGNRSPISPSFFALAFLLLLVVASAIFYVAGLELADETPWAVEVCDRARNFCEHPEWSAIPAVLMGVVFLAAKGMEL